MTRTFTADESKEEFRLTMGPTIGPLYHELWQEVVQLHFTWNEYVCLFGTKPTRIDILNSTATFFFGIVHDAMWENVLLHIARLTDAHKIAGRENLTLETLCDALKGQDIEQDFRKLLGIAKQEASFCRDWRNRRIAHRDLALALDPESVPLKSGSREAVTNTLKAIAAAMDVVSDHYTHGVTAFDGSPYPGGAIDLIYVLDDGLEAAAERDKRRSERKATPEDDAIRDL